MGQKYLIIYMRLLYRVHMHIALLVTLEAKDVFFCVCLNLDWSPCIWRICNS